MHFALTEVLQLSIQQQKKREQSLTHTPNTNALRTTRRNHKHMLAISSNYTHTNTPLLTIPSNDLFLSNSTIWEQKFENMLPTPAGLKGGPQQKGLEDSRFS